MTLQEVHILLEERYSKYATKHFLKDDPISIPHRFSNRADIEIMAFFAATLAWGQRDTIIKSCLQLESLFDHAPFEFATGYTEHDLKRLERFVHRTFQPTDLLFCLDRLRAAFVQHTSLQQVFFPEPDVHNRHAVEHGIIRFHHWFFSPEYAPVRTRKHVATPARKSACKRLNMFLRWMVRSPVESVDFGLWHHVSPAQLICPCDLHVGRVARHLGLIRRHQNDWNTAIELTEQLRLLDPIDPIRFDIALFSMGVEERIR